ncbi:MAG: hypothetical protein KAR40_06165 [Candidatus Sabulitectum sp.]|nr:hypothetical protein [Candidatus Sabulitectum sp.]
MKLVMYLKERNNMRKMDCVPFVLLALVVGFFFGAWLVTYDVCNRRIGEIKSGEVIIKDVKYKCTPVEERKMKWEPIEEEKDE